MISKFIDKWSNEFFADGNDIYELISVTYGIDGGMHRPDYNRWDPGVNRGEVVWTKNFEIYNTEFIKRFIWTCRTFREEACELEACNHPDKLLAIPNTDICFLSEFL